MWTRTTRRTRTSSASSASSMRPIRCNLHALMLCLWFRWLTRSQAQCAKACLALMQIATSQDSSSDTEPISDSEPMANLLRSASSVGSERTPDAYDTQPWSPGPLLWVALADGSMAAAPVPKAPQTEQRVRPTCTPHSPAEEQRIRPTCTPRSLNDIVDVSDSDSDCPTLRLGPPRSSPLARDLVLLSCVVLAPAFCCRTD